MRTNTGIVWFRQDLRLGDNPALHTACKECDEVFCLFVDDPLKQSVSQLGSASRVWLHHSLTSLDDALTKRGNKLHIAKGDSEAILKKVAKRIGATAVYWNRCYDPMTIRRDKKIKASLADFHPQSFNALLNEEPWDAVKSDGTPYRVFTPFWRMRAPSLPGAKPLPTPRSIPAVNAPSTKELKLSSIDKLALLPDLPWHEAMMKSWRVGERAALQTLKKFTDNAILDYDENRNLPAIAGTSQLSPHLHFGEISPRQIMHRVCNGETDLNHLSHGQETFLKEVIWREFAYNLLFHFPHTINKPLDKRFDDFPWEKRIKKPLTAWQQGRTGVPIVDAGMRELYATGWMHNRVRMIVASYLIKNLLVPWQHGEKWFRDTLIDADLASNAMGWQWAAGSGADAAPYFRIFNPVLQGEKFDKRGEYVRHWVPELASVSDKFIHKPWELPEAERDEVDYPEPLVDLKQSRQRALAAFDKIKSPT